MADIKSLVDLIKKEDPNWNALLSSSTQEDDSPIPLTENLPNSNHFPVDELGKILGNIAKEIHRIIGTPLASSAQSILSAVSLVTQPHADINLFGRVHPLSLFIITVGKSGERKSAGDQIALKEIKDYEWEKQKKYQEEMISYQKSLTDGMGNKKNINNDIVRQPPREQILLMQEPSYEGMIQTFEKGQPSLGLFTEEGGRFLGGYAMNEENKTKTSTGLCELWDGSPISRIRVKEGSKKLYGKRLSIHLMLQPHHSDKLFQDKELKDQGFLGRCLISYPKSEMGKRKFVSENIYDSQCYFDYKNQIRFLLQKEKKYNHAASYSLNPRPLSFNQEALNELKLFYSEIESELHEKGKYSEISSFANKAIEHASRIAGILNCFYYPDKDQISADIFLNAKKIILYYLDEMLRLFSDQDVNLIQNSNYENRILAQNFYDWLQIQCHQHKELKDKNNVFTLRFLMQYCPRKFRDKEIIQKMLNILLDYGWIKIEENWKKWKLVEVKK